VLVLSKWASGRTV